MSYTNGSVALAQRVRRQQGGARQPDGCAPGGATGNMSAHQRGAVRRRSPELESRTPRGVLPATEIRRRMNRLNPAGQRFVLGWISREAEVNADLESILSRALGNQWIEANGFEGGKGVGA